jgi:hypothetical protein
MCVLTSYPIYKVTSDVRRLAVSMEETEDRIADLARGYGLTSDEAKILDHLIEAADLYTDLPDNYDKDIHAWMEYQQSMARMLMWRAQGVTTPTVGLP